MRLAFIPKKDRNRSETPNGSSYKGLMDELTLLIRQEDCFATLKYMRNLLDRLKGSKKKPLVIHESILPDSIRTELGAASEAEEEAVVKEFIKKLVAKDKETWKEMLESLSRSSAGEQIIEEFKAISPFAEAKAA